MHREDTLKVLSISPSFFTTLENEELQDHEIFETGHAQAGQQILDVLTYCFRKHADADRTLHKQIVDQTKDLQKVFELHEALSGTEKLIPL